MTSEPAEPHGGSDRPEEALGGETACWAHRVCPVCGRLSDIEAPEVCEACGTGFSDRPAR